jgi:hypothetical protein
MTDSQLAEMREQVLEAEESRRVLLARVQTVEETFGLVGLRADAAAHKACAEALRAELRDWYQGQLDVYREAPEVGLPELPNGLRVGRRNRLEVTDVTLLPAECVTAVRSKLRPGMPGVTEIETLYMVVEK